MPVFDHSFDYNFEVCVLVLIKKFDCEIFISGSQSVCATNVSSKLRLFILKFISIVA
jgi:hypothetical protein